MSYIFGKLWHSAIIWPIRKSFQCILQGVRFLLANHTLLSGTSENESYIEEEVLVLCNGVLTQWVILMCLWIQEVVLEVIRLLLSNCDRKGFIVNIGRSSIRCEQRFSKQIGEEVLEVNRVPVAERGHQQVTWHDGATPHWLDLKLFESNLQHTATHSTLHGTHSAQHGLDLSHSE